MNRQKFIFKTKIMKISILKITIIVIMTLTINVILAQDTEVFKAENGMYGLKDDKGKTLIEPIYKHIYKLNIYLICDCGYVQDVCVVDNGKKKALFSTKQMKLTTDFIFDTIYPISTDDLGVAQIGDKIGLIRCYTGKLITPIEMDEIVYLNWYADSWGWMRTYVMKHKYIHLIRNGKDELYDTDGKLVMSDYDSEKYIIIDDFINKNVYLIKRSEIGPFENGKSKVTINGEEFYINEKGDRKL